MKKIVYDPDPIINEIRAVRAKIGRKYPTMEAYFEHLRNLPSAAELHEQLKAKLALQEKRREHARLSRKQSDGVTKKQVYVETSVISYLTSRPARDVILLARQQFTAKWWEQRDEWDLCLSSAVLEELADGDPDAARRRLAIADTITKIQKLPSATMLADELIRSNAVPTIAAADATHLAIASTHGIPLLLTWNQRHLDNPSCRQKISAVIMEMGFLPPFVLTPERLLEKEI